MSRDVTEIKTWAGKTIGFVCGPCDHEPAVPVESGGELVAWLCTECDQQLPAEWRTA